MSFKYAFLNIIVEIIVGELGAGTFQRELEPVKIKYGAESQGAENRAFLEKVRAGAIKFLFGEAEPRTGEQKVPAPQHWNLRFMANM